MLVAGDLTPFPSATKHPVVMIVGEAKSVEVKLLERHLGAYSLVACTDLGKTEQVARKTGARAVIMDASREHLPESRATHTCHYLPAA